MWVTQEENMIATILDMPPSSSKVKLEQRLHSVNAASSQQLRAIEVSPTFRLV